MSLRCEVHLWIGFVFLQALNKKLAKFFNERFQFERYVNSAILKLGYIGKGG